MSIHKTVDTIKVVIGNGSEQSQHPCFGYVIDLPAHASYAFYIMVRRLQHGVSA